MLTTCNPGGNTSVARLWIVRPNTKRYFKIRLIICLLAYDLAALMDIMPENAPSGWPNYDVKKPQ